MTTRPRATVEDTLTNLCDSGRLNGLEQETMLRLWTRGLQCAWDGGFVPLRVWRAFYRRHPDAMLHSMDLAVRSRAEQFKAQDHAAAAGKVVDDMMKGRM